MISSTENVARAIFSPRMIYNGELQTEAFQLREAISERYISVLRMSVATWHDDMLKIPSRKNRMLFGFAEMNVGDIRRAGFANVAYDVEACDNEKLTSHAEIFITVDGRQLVGGEPVSATLSSDAQNFLLLMIQRRLVEIARRGLNEIRR